MECSSFHIIHQPLRNPSLIFQSTFISKNTHSSLQYSIWYNIIFCTVMETAGKRSNTHLSRGTKKINKCPKNSKPK